VKSACLLQRLPIQFVRAQARVGPRVVIEYYPATFA